MIQRSNQQWIEHLSSDDERHVSALEDLGVILTRGLPRALSRWIDTHDPRRDAFIQDVVQDTLLRVVDKLETFQGRSKFTTWVYKIAVRIALSEIRKSRWKETSLDELMDEGKMAMPSREKQVSVEKRVERDELLDMVMQIMERELSEKQRMALSAVVMTGMPLEEVANRLQTKRNALYKLLHDARKKMKQAVEGKGLSWEEILSAFSN